MARDAFRCSGLEGDPVDGYDAPRVTGTGIRVHETAIVEPGAYVGPGTSIWHHTHVRSTAHVGSGCTLGKNVYVDADVTIGNRAKIQNNVSVFSGVTLGDEVFVGPSAVFTNDRLPRAVNDGWEIVRTEVRRGASIGANATIVCGIEIGQWATVGAGAVVTHSVTDHELVVGNPARHAGWVCRCGTVISRSEEPPADLRCPACRQDGASVTRSPLPGSGG
jgi:acetyltransferase-like isoleucine patch superfamily enzyme